MNPIVHILRKLPSRPLVILAGLSLFVAYLSVQDYINSQGAGFGVNPGKNQLLTRD